MKNQVVIRHNTSIYLVLYGDGFSAASVTIITSNGRTSLIYKLKLM
jgi:hypothetical protein